MRPRKMTRIIRGAAPTASTSASAQGTASTPQHRSLLMAPGGWSVSVSSLTSSSRSLLSSPVHARQDDVDDNLPAESRPPASPTRRRAPRGLDQSAESSRYAPPVPTSSKRSVPKPPRRSLAAPVLTNPKLTLKFADGTSEKVDMHPDSIRNSPSLFRPRKPTDPPPRITIIRNKPGMLPGTARPSPSPVVSISVSATTASTATSIRPPRDSTNPAAMVSSLAPSTVLLAPPLASASVTPRVFIAPPEPMAPPPSPPPGNGWASAQRWIRAHADEPFFVASSSRNRKNKTDKRNRAKNKKLKRRPRIDKTRTARNSDSSPTESTITTHVRVDPQRSGAARRPGRIPGDPTGVVRCDPEGLAGIRLEELALYDSIAAHGRKMWEFKQAKEQDREESARMEDMMETTAMEVRRSINDHGLALDVDSVDGSSTSTLAESSRQVPDTAARELQMRTDPLRDFHLPEGPDFPEEPDALPATRASLGEQGAMANPWFYVYTVIRMAERHQLCAWVHISAEDVPRIEKGMKDCKAQGCGMCHELVLKNHEWWVAIMDEEDKEHLESFIVKRELEEDGGGAYDLIRWGADPEEIDKGVTARKKVGQYMTGLFHGFVVWFDALT